MKILLCCIGKNENRYIREFVEHYKNIGFSKIRLYDNNDPDGERFEEVIGDYIDSGFVEMIDYRGEKMCQIKAYNECYKEYSNEYDWIAFFDIDEFLELNGYKNINNYLSNEMFDNYDMIHINWMVYGDNDILFYNKEQLVKRFKTPISLDKCIAYSFPENYHIKSIIKGGINNFIWEGTPHTPVLELKCCNADGLIVSSRSPLVVYSFKNAFLKHYGTKTIEEYCDKMKRGFPDQLWDGSKIKKLLECNFFKTNDITKEKIEVVKNKLDIDMSYLIKDKIEKDKKIQIFTLCFQQKDFDFIDDAVVTPLQVGADINICNVCELKDNSGDNISIKNYFYIENTGTYWIWKNIKDAKYKGQMQYRRPLKGVNENMNFDDIFSQYDVITCTPFNHPFNSQPTKENPMFIPAQTVEEGYAFSNCRDDIAILEMIINIYYPEYKESYKKYIKQGSDLYYSNGFVMKAEDFDKYCEFLFGCLEKYEQFVDISTPEKLRSRVISNMMLGKYPKHMILETRTEAAIKWQMSIGGFLSERIWTLWLQHNFNDEKILKLPYNKMEEGMYT